MSDDFTRELIKQYNKFKSFNIFGGCYYLREGENLPLSEMVKITRIGADKNTGFFTAYYGDSFNQHTIFMSPNKDDFLKGLANGVYRAINAIYEKEKKEQLPTMQWQDEKDKLKRFKSILAEWRENSPHAR